MPGGFIWQPYVHSIATELPPSTVGLSKESDRSRKYNFLSFLATVQATETRILPITWQSVRQDIGHGGTSRISQALANIRMSLAFKRIKNEEKFEKTEAEIFQMLINEILVLGHPSIQAHPYIALLQGICWDISPNGKVWPVLVFEKSEFDDLSHFARRPIGKKMNFHQRLELCAGIGEAIIYMHSHNIIHGDIKPENVLIFKNNDGMYIPRMIDFGYSTSYMNAIKMPLTPPWNAPEHYRLNKTWTSLEAQKIDCFSFGMLCLWLLFEKKLSTLTLSSQNGEFWKAHGRSCSFGQPIEILQDFKANQKLLLLTQHLLKIKKFHSNDDRTALSEFFDSILHEDQNNRDISAGNLFKKNHRPTYRTSDQFEKIELEVFDSDFKISRSLNDFYRSDYRVRVCIAKCIEEAFFQASASSVSSETMKQLAYQLAECYKLGFGVKRDSNKASEVLTKSRCEINETEEIVGQDKRLTGDERFLESEDLPLIDYFSYYLENGVLDQAEKQLRQEIKDVEQVLDSDSDVPMFLKNKLASLLDHQGRWSEAEQLSLQQYNIIEKALGTQHPNTIQGMNNLAVRYTNQGKLNEAENLLTKALKLSESSLRKAHPVTLASMNNLASILGMQDRFYEAKEIGLKALEISTKTWGAEHPDTVFSMTILADVYSKRFQWKKAKKLGLRVLEISEEMMGTEHPRTISAMINLANIYNEQEEWKKAEKLELKVLEISRNMLGEEHPTTLTILNDLAAAYEGQNQWTKAKTVWLDLIEISRKTIGAEHPVTMKRMSSLAAIYIKEGQLDEAEEIELRVLGILKKSIKAEAMHIVLSMENLNKIYKLRNQLDQAEKLTSDILKEFREIFGTAHPFTLYVMSKLTNIYIGQGRRIKGLRIKAKEPYLYSRKWKTFPHLGL